jgi:hypothetical protein
MNVFTVEEYETNGKTNKRWTKIGAAFPHKDGTGFSIELERSRSTAASSSSRPIPRTTTATINRPEHQLQPDAPAFVLPWPQH